MTQRLYYTDAFLLEFSGHVVEALVSPRPALILDRTAFYPTSGGQVFDTGMLREGMPGANPDMTPDDIARTALFLAHTAPPALTGACIDVYG